MTPGAVRAEGGCTSDGVSRVADARIIYSSRGVLADANKPGLLTRFFNLPFMPL